MSSLPAKSATNAGVSWELDKTEADVWSIWYAARFGKAERVRFILNRNKTGASVDEREPVDELQCTRYSG